MPDLILLVGLLLFMMGSIWTIGEALKKDLLYGVAALILPPVYGAAMSILVPEKKWIHPFLLMLGGGVIFLIGLAILYQTAA